MIAPTVPSRRLSGRLRAMTGEVSVSPYPSKISTPAPMKNAASSADSGAPPERMKRTRPPRRSLIFLKTSLSARVDLIARPGGIGAPVMRYGRRRSATPSAHLKIFCFPADCVATLSRILARIFSKSRGTAAKACGRISCRFSPTVVIPSA